MQSLHSGVGRHAWDLLKALELRNYRPRILPSVPSLDPAFASRQLPLSSRLPRSRIKPWSLFVADRELRSLLRQMNKPCVLHGLSNYNLPAVSQPLLKKVLTVHDLIPLTHREQVSVALGAYLRYQLPRALRHADAVICVSKWTESCLHELFPDARSKTLVIPNGWPLLQTKERHLPSQAPRLLTVSRLESYKRLELIPEILQLLPPETQWTLVTDSKGAETLRDAATPQLKIRSGLGEIELRALHHSAEAYVHPSLWEGFCLPAADSIAAGVPVIHTLGSGIDEVVSGAGRGLPPAASAQMWADSILELLANSDNEQKCMQRTTQALSWDDVAASTVELYAKLGMR